MTAAASVPPLVVHVLHRFDVGGLENGVVNLINAMPPERYRHAVIALTDCADEFAARIGRTDVRFHSLHKPPGHGFRVFPQFHRLMRTLRPAIVHTRNLAALEMVVPALLAGVPVRVHGEHGWDSRDPEGTNRKYRLVRRAFAPMVSHYVALSGHLQRYLVDAVGISAARIARICNGVDAQRFRAAERRDPLPGMPFGDADEWIFGTVGRLQEVKDQITLVRAFSRLISLHPEARRRARLVIAGDGPLRAAVEREIGAGQLGDRVWLAGSRSDVPRIMRALDCFVLPSRAEGISNTILEAMASGLPVIATAVGGNPELVVDRRCGWLVPPCNPEAMAEAMAQSLAAPQQSREFGTVARQRIEAEFSLDAMVRQYADLYDRLLAVRRGGR